MHGTGNPGMRIQSEYERRLINGGDIQGHLRRLYEEVMCFPGASVTEIGVRRGNSTAALLAAVYQVKGRLRSIDIRRPVVPRWWWSLSRWTFEKGHSLRVEARPCDLLFLDGSHRETAQELSLHGDLADTIIVHDTDIPEVSQAMDDYGHWERVPGWNGLGILKR
jgi:hypothetical protein